MLFRSFIVKHLIVYMTLRKKCAFKRGERESIVKTARGKKERGGEMASESISEKRRRRIDKGKKIVVWLNPPSSTLHINFTKFTLLNNMMPENLVFWVLFLSCSHFLMCYPYPLPLYTLLLQKEAKKYPWRRFLAVRNHALRSDWLFSNFLIKLSVQN